MSSYRMKYKIGATQYHIPVQEDIAGFGSGVPLGTILPYSANSEYPPEGFLWCDGSAVSRAAYPDLFSLIGTTYGSGDGVSTFNLPDLRGRVAQGASATNPVGMYKEAGLPNITGEYSPYSSYGAVDIGRPSAASKLDGAFVAGNYTFSNCLSGQSGVQTKSLGLDASQSNPIYGNSDTVQPSAACVNYIIKAFSATSSNSELVDVTELSTEITRKADHRTDFTIIYPNNGTAENPANVTANSRYVMDNPFPGYAVFCVAEVFWNSQWGPTERYLAVSSSTYYSYGTKAGQINNDIIAIKTGSSAVFGNPLYSISPIDGTNWTSAPTSLPCRVKVWKIGKILQSS